MAELVAVLGVASSVAQLTEAVFKLRYICGSLKYGPTDLTELLTEMSISTKQLEKSKEFLQKASLLDGELFTECFEYLQQALLTVNTVSAKLHKTFNRHPAVGSIKFVWKSDQIEKLRQKLERAQRLMDRTERLLERAERENTT